MNDSHITTFADALGIDRDIAIEVFGGMWDDYTLEGLPRLRERWGDMLAQCATDEDRAHVEGMIGYKMWRLLEDIAAAYDAIYRVMLQN